MEAVSRGDWRTSANASEAASEVAWSSFLAHAGWRRPCDRELYMFAELLLALSSDGLGDALSAILHVDRAFIFASAGPVRDAVMLFVRWLDEEAQATRVAASHSRRLPSFVVAPRWAPRMRLPEPEVASASVQGIPRLSLDDDGAHKRLFAAPEPFVVEGCLHSWPAFVRWRTLGFLDKVAGHRLVPLELGASVGGSTWREEMMPLGDFLRQHLAASCEFCSADADAEEPPNGDFEAGVAYLAQHELLEQCPQLRADVEVPKPWAKHLGQPTRVNAWLGTHGTVTPCHWDSYDNCLAQVQGTKQVVLLAPDMAPYLCVEKPSAATGGTSAQGNIARVDVEAPDLEKFPAFAKATRHLAELGPGDALFIPSGWWHQVRALSPSFSVNFWF